MKKWLILLLSALLAVSTLLLSACGDGSEKPAPSDDPVIIDPPDDGGDDGELDDSRFQEPETGFVIDGVIGDAEKEKYNTLGQKYGVEGQIVFSYYIGTKGIYFHFDVNDPKVFKANVNENEAGSSDYIYDSDRVEIFIDTKADGGSAPQTDDYHVMMTCEGYNQVLVGNGSAFKRDGSYGLDKCVAVIKEGTTVSERDKNATKVPQSSKNVDPGYTIEAFLSYENFGFAKKDIYKLSVAQADMWHVTDMQRFNVAGSNTVPDEFRTLSQYGLGTAVELEKGISIDAKKDAYYTQENVAADANLYYFAAERAYAQSSVKGKMKTEAYVYCGQNGLYVYMFAQSDYLRYYYADFPYYSDHVEIRIDTNNNKASDATATGDRWFFMDIMGASQTAYGIDNSSRVTGAYDLVATTAYTGEISDAKDAPALNVGSTDDKTFTFEAFFPWTSLNVAPGAAFGMILECGNPNEGASGIGNIFYPDADYSVTEHWHTFEKYNYYTEFKRP